MRRYDLLVGGKVLYWTLQPTLDEAVTVLRSERAACFLDPTAEVLPCS